MQPSFFGPAEKPAAKKAAWLCYYSKAAAEKRKKTWAWPHTCETINENRRLLSPPAPYHYYGEERKEGKIGTEGRKKHREKESILPSPISPRLSSSLNKKAEKAWRRQQQKNRKTNEKKGRKASKKKRKSRGRERSDRKRKREGKWRILTFSAKQWENDHPCNLHGMRKFSLFCSPLIQSKPSSYAVRVVGMGKKKMGISSSFLPYVFRLKKTNKRRQGRNH